jgi:two-component system CheB/CheR fusion protein
VVLGLGLAVAVLLSLAVHLAQKTAQRAAERRRAEQALRKAYDELESRVQERTAELSAVNARLSAREEELAAADRRKNEFLAMLGHEIRNPLSTVVLGLKAVELDGIGDPQLRETLKVMEQRVHFIARLVDDLLDVSRIARGKILLRRAVVELNLVVREAVENVRPLIAARGHSLDVIVSCEPVYVVGDAVRLQQIISNLLHNAVKYTEPGGRITLIVGRQVGEVFVRVRDTGVGIPDDLQDRIFEPFEQGTRSAEEGEGGLGIGLTLVRTLVELHGGRVEVFSEGAGRGSEFSVALPCVPVPERAHKAPIPDVTAPRSAALGARHRILIVDDERDIAGLLSRLLDALGHETHAVYDGPAAIEAARKIAPNLVLVDIGLPGMDGCEVARKLRDQAGSRTLCLVALTGLVEPERRRRCLEAGFDHFVPKPLDFARLKGLLAAVRLPESDRERPGTSGSQGRRQGVQAHAS